MDSIQTSHWWILQLQLLEREKQQMDLFIDPLKRNDLITRSIKRIPKEIKLSRNNSVWGFADVQRIEKDLYAFLLTVRPPSAKIGQEIEPGHLEETKDYRYWTWAIVNVSEQIIFVHRSSDVSRYARSATTFAEIFQNLFFKAIESFEMHYYYNIEVDPIAVTGSFIEWFKSLEVLKTITFTYRGPNLPSGPGSLVKNLKNTGKILKDALHSKEVEIVSKKPEVSDEEVEELDLAVSKRKLKLRARGVRKGVTSTWSSDTKPRPETATIPIGEKDLKNPREASRILNKYIYEIEPQEKIE